MRRRRKRKKRERGGGSREKKGGGIGERGMYCYRFEVRQSSESVTSRNIYMEIPHAFGETCFSLRLVSRFGRERRRRGFGTAYINTHGPSNQLRETSLASLLRKLLPRTFAAFFFISLFLLLSHPPHLFILSLLILQPFPLSIFVPSRSINSEPDSFRIALHREGSS